MDFANEENTVPMSLPCLTTSVAAGLCCGRAHAWLAGMHLGPGTMETRARPRAPPRTPQVASYYPKKDRMLKHPLVRAMTEEEYRAGVEDRRKLGKGPPKKGMGKRASRKK